MLLKVSVLEEVLTLARIHLYKPICRRHCNAPPAHLWRCQHFPLSSCVALLWPWVTRSTDSQPPKGPMCTKYPWLQPMPKCPKLVMDLSPSPDQEVLFGSGCPHRNFCSCFHYYYPLLSAARPDLHLAQPMPWLSDSTMSWCPIPIYTPTIANGDYSKGSPVVKSTQSPIGSTTPVGLLTAAF